MAKAEARVPRLRSLRNAGAAAWNTRRTGIAPAINYGLSVIGRGGSQVARARSLVGATAFTNTAGRWLTLSYLLHPAKGLDPMFAARRGPPLAWASAVRKVNCLSSSCAVLSVNRKYAAENVSLNESFSTNFITCCRSILVGGVSSKIPSPRKTAAVLFPITGFAR